MCGRFVLKHSPGELQARFRFAETRFRLQPRYNIAPSTDVAVVVAAADEPRLLRRMRWGLIPEWALDTRKLPLLFNARSDTLATKPAFRSAFATRRCLVPASGYYEWQKVGTGKQPWFIASSDGRPLAFAAIWEQWRPPDAEPIETVAIVTTDAPAPLNAIHVRMPILLDESGEANWLTPGPLGEREFACLRTRSPGGSIEIRRVSTRVNRVQEDDAGLVEPLVE